MVTEFFSENFRKHLENSWMNVIVILQKASWISSTEAITNLEKLVCSTITISLLIF